MSAQGGIHKVLGLFYLLIEKCLVLLQTLLAIKATLSREEL